MRALILVAFSMTAWLGCGSAGECDKACRNYYTLHYWEAANAEIAKLPEAEREALRKQKLMELDERANKGITLCTKQCTTAASKDQIKCMIEARTAPDAKKCLE